MLVLAKWPRSFELESVLQHFQTKNGEFHTRKPLLNVFLTNCQSQSCVKPHQVGILPPRRRETVKKFRKRQKKRHWRKQNLPGGRRQARQHA
jgi:hypothetical protein